MASPNNPDAPKNLPSSTVPESKDRDLIPFENEPDFLSLLQKAKFLSRGFTAFPSDWLSFLGFEDSPIGPNDFPDQSIFECTPSQTPFGLKLEHRFGLVVRFYFVYYTFISYYQITELSILIYLVAFIYNYY